MCLSEGRLVGPKIHSSSLYTQGFCPAIEHYEILASHLQTDNHFPLSLCVRIHQLAHKSSFHLLGTFLVHITRLLDIRFLSSANRFPLSRVLRCVANTLFTQIPLLLILSVMGCDEKFNSKKYKKFCTRTENKTPLKVLINYKLFIQLDFYLICKHEN